MFINVIFFFGELFYYYFIIIFNNYKPVEKSEINMSKGYTNSNVQ